MVQPASPSPCAHGAFEQVYEMGALLGQGGFGEVRYAVHRQTGDKVAVKIIQVPEGRRGPKIHKLLKQEVAILKGVSHPSLIRLKEVYRLGATFYLVTEYCRGGELLGQLIEERYTENEAREVMRQLAKGLAYLHKRGIVHRDLKLENILLASLNDRTRVKIADFGLATSISRGPLTSISGSVLYVAPEILACQIDPDASYDQRVDVWSLGVALYILLSGVAPFEHEDIEEMMRRISCGEFNFSPAPFRAVSEEAKRLIQSMLTVDPDERITVEELVRHPWLAASLGRGVVVAHRRGHMRVWDSATETTPRVEPLSPLDAGAALSPMSPHPGPFGRAGGAQGSEEEELRRGRAPGGAGEAGAREIAPRGGAAGGSSSSSSAPSSAEGSPIEQGGGFRVLRAIRVGPWSSPGRPGTGTPRSRIDAPSPLGRTCEHSRGFSSSPSARTARASTGSVCVVENPPTSWGGGMGSPGGPASRRGSGSGMCAADGPTPPGSRRGSGAGMMGGSPLAGGERSGRGAECGADRPPTPRARRGSGGGLAPGSPGGAGVCVVLPPLARTESKERKESPLGLSQLARSDSQERRDARLAMGEPECLQA